MTTLAEAQQAVTDPKNARGKAARDARVALETARQARIDADTQRLREDLLALDTDGILTYDPENPCELTYTLATGCNGWVNIENQCDYNRYVAADKGVKYRLNSRWMTKATTVIKRVREHIAEVAAEHAAHQARKNAMADGRAELLSRYPTATIRDYNSRTLSVSRAGRGVVRFRPYYHLGELKLVIETVNVDCNLQREVATLILGEAE